MHWDDLEGSGGEGVGRGDQDGGKKRKKKKIPACASSSPAFLMMYSAYKLNKQGD